METRSKLKSQITIINKGEEIEVTEDINDIENGGEIEGGVNVRIGQIIETEPELQTQSQQTKSVEKVKDSTIDFEARLLACMKKLEDGMTKMNSEFKDILTETENNIKENVREPITSVTKDMHRRVDQIIESEKDEVNGISLPTHSRIQIQTDTAKCNESEKSKTQLKHQSSSSHNEEKVKEPGTLAAQAHAHIEQGIVSQVKCTLSGNSSDSNHLHSPAVSTKAYSEGRDECELTASWINDCGNEVTPSRDIRQQQMSSSQGAPHHVSPIIFTSVAGSSQTSSTAKSPGGSPDTKCTRTAYTSSQLFQMEREFRKNNCLYRPHHISRQSSTWVRNWKKRKKTQG
jgi:hypothetical protein